MDAECIAQDPFATVPEHYQLLFDNEWVQVAKISYKPLEKAPVHDHPAARRSTFTRPMAVPWFSAISNSAISGARR